MFSLSTKRFPKAFASLLRYVHTSQPTFALQYAKTGDPRKVLEMRTINQDNLLRSPTDVIIKMLAAPINPSDINMIEGNYGVKASLPAIGGNEGVGIVESVGNAVSSLKVNDIVIPSTPGKGTWRTHLILSENEVSKVPASTPLEEAAMISVNPSTAYRILHDIVSLSPGDTVMQNAGSSALGQAMIQIAKTMGLRTVSVIRQRPGMEQTRDYLYSLGADAVFTDRDFLDRKKIQRELEGRALASPRLMLNSVGGPLVTDMAKMMSQSGTVCTFGGMSLQPITIPTALLIFKDLRYCGFWMTRWISEHSKEEHEEMLHSLCNMAIEGNLKTRHKKFDFETHYNDAINHALSDNRQCKAILTFK
eukprot:GCRY01002350.1.p1 GENE.GCRY01002350.1~~GCRY01002350.1.p1  ORF type:complete len:363 (+),score=21.86 GCRY01002350.1:156-1244(+)